MALYRDIVSHVKQQKPLFATIVGGKYSIQKGVGEGGHQLLADKESEFLKAALNNIPPILG